MVPLVLVCFNYLPFRIGLYGVGLDDSHVMIPPGPAQIYLVSQPVTNR